VKFKLDENMPADLATYLRAAKISSRSTWGRSWMGTRRCQRSTATPSTSSGHRT
jgi:hypothetical protein